MHPEIIVFDEPTAVLDPEGRAEVLDTIAQLHKSGKTIIAYYALHGRGAFCRQGRRHDSRAHHRTGTPREVFADEDALRQAGLDAPPHIALYHSLTAEV